MARRFICPAGVRASTLSANRLCAVLTVDAMGRAGVVSPQSLYGTHLTDVCELLCVLV